MRAPLLTPEPQDSLRALGRPLAAHLTRWTNLGLEGNVPDVRALGGTESGAVCGVKQMDCFAVALGQLAGQTVA